MSDAQPVRPDTGPNQDAPFPAGPQPGGDITVHGSVSGTGIAIGHNNVVQVTTVYEWVRRQPADPQTVAAGRILLDQLTTEPIDCRHRPALPPGSHDESRSGQL